MTVIKFCYDDDDDDDELEIVLALHAEKHEIQFYVNGSVLVNKVNV